MEIHLAVNTGEAFTALRVNLRKDGLREKIQVHALVDITMSSRERVAMPSSSPWCFWPTP